MEVALQQPAHETPSENMGVVMAGKDKIIAEQAETIRQLKFTVERMQAQWEKHLRARFGLGSEKVDPATLLPYAQAAVANLIAAGEAVSEQVKTEPAAEVSNAPATRPKRKKLPKNLERVVITHRLPEDQRACPCCGKPMGHLGYEECERLQYVPAKVFVEVHKTEKCACIHCRNNGCGRPGCEGRIVEAAKPPQAIEKGQAGAGLLAQVIVGKYGDHLPLYRLEDILKRHHLDITRSTLCDWAMACSDLFAPLVARMKERILGGLALQMDDTPVEMLEPGNGQTKTARLWVYQGDEQHRLTMFDFAESRRQEHPKEWMVGTGFQGHGQCDAYAGYDPLFDPQRTDKGNPCVMTPIGCWAHVRRKFKEALDAGETEAGEMVHLIQKLYVVEKSAKAEAGIEEDATHAVNPHKNPEGIRPEQVEKLWGVRKAYRRQSEAILVQQIKPWLDGKQQTVLPRSALGEAITYAQNQWPRLIGFAQHGHLEIDNNAAERSVRGIAIGRKNWQFAGSPRGGRALAMFASVITSAKLHQLEPYEYVKDLLERLPAIRNAGWPAEELDVLLPDRWQPPRK